MIVPSCFVVKLIPFRKKLCKW
ncbi:hypothetical protein GWI33_010727, partial [Rhynchophorus ferrugineus]